mgnify:CR=1 FL=1
MEPVRLEILLDDKTLKGMRSVEGNLSGIGLYAKQVIAQLEQELLAAINELGIGPQGFGGRTTCLGLAIEQMPTHVAGLPAAVNVSCHVTRRASAEL